MTMKKLIMFTVLIMLITVPDMKDRKKRHFKKILSISLLTGNNNIFENFYLGVIFQFLK